MSFTDNETKRNIQNKKIKKHGRHKKFFIRVKKTEPSGISSQCYIEHDPE